MYYKKIIIIFVLMLWMLAAAACSEQKNNEGTQEGSYGSQEVEKSGFENFTASDLEGNEVTQDIFAGYSLTMINIWGTFCGPCISEMPELQKISTEYKEKGVQVIGVVADASDFDGVLNESIVADAKDIVEQTGADYIHILPAKELIDSKLSKVSAVPETIFVDSEGKQVGVSYMGARDEAKWKEIIDTLLEEK